MTLAARPDETLLRRRWRNRLMLGAFAVSAFVFLVLPQLLVWVGSAGVCPSSVMSHGKSDGTAWEVLRNDCGSGGIVWQMRIIPDRGYSAVVMESRGGPEPVGWEQSGFVGTVILSSAPKGATSVRINVDLDPKGQPLGQLDFLNGERRVPAAKT
jgi:hypothetical protein